MTDAVNELHKNDYDNYGAGKQEATNLNSRRALLQRLRRGRRVRATFVESQISKSIAFQIRGLRDREGWSQQTLAEKIGSNQNAIYRAEKPNYGKQTITTLKKIAAEFDVALIVRFVPFSELIDWVSGTPRITEGLNSNALDVPNFDTEEKKGAFEDRPEPTKEQPGEGATASRTQVASLQDLAAANIKSADYEYVRGIAEQMMSRAVEAVKAYSYRGAGLTLQHLGGDSQTELEQLPSLLDQWEDYNKSLAEAIAPMPGKVVFIDSKDGLNKAKRNARRSRKRGSGLRQPRMWTA